MKTLAQKNQTQLWNHLYRASLFAQGSLGPLGRVNPAKKDIKKKFEELQEYLEQVIKQAELETTE